MKIWVIQGNSQGHDIMNDRALGENDEVSGIEFQNKIHR